MLLDQVDFHKRRVRYTQLSTPTPQSKWLALTADEQSAIRLVVTNAVHTGVSPEPKSISAFLLERLGVWVSADEVSAVLSATHASCVLSPVI